ncbi:MAG: endonuclease/exonuclease/phosphatase family protein [Treponema sp.]|jgi:endonuclease/exonuclease/phosphatase family metal-dependent hydrolase|nr:endonuclease/exonuclease/phosphatase family protein [Treponema sp.]
MKTFLKIVKIAGLILALIIVIFGIFVGVLTITEYRPKEKETLEITGTGGSRSLAAGTPFKILSWNIGYASLDATEDFFMDGGTHVRPAKNTNVKNNIENIKKLVTDPSWDAVLIQEVDTHSFRSYWVNQVEYLTGGYAGSWTLGYNFKAAFVPYPVPEFIGPVQSGILSMTAFAPREALRIRLPSPFKWPVRIANLKRCLLAEWIPIENSSRELVLVNLHLEAYSSDSGRLAQMLIMMDFLNAEYARGNYCIAGGDFNQSFPGIDPELFRIKNDDYFVAGTLTPGMLQSGWQFASDTQTPSARLLNEPYSGSYEDTQLYVIDGFILSPNVRLKSVKTLADGFKYSDHHPVSLEVILED